MEFIHVAFIDKVRTADYTITTRLIQMIQDGALKDDIIGFLSDKGLPGDEIIYDQLADEILNTDIKQGFLTISNALQWRLNYHRILKLNNSIVGVNNCDFNK